MARVRSNFRNRGQLLLLACALVAPWATGCDGNFPGKPKPADRPVPEDRVVDFGLLYRRNCAGCHGADGRLGPAPPLNDAIFLAIVPDAELLRVIREGRPGTPMPAFALRSGGALTDAQVGALAGGIKPRWQSATTPSEPHPAYLLTKADTAPSSADVQAHGAEIFARAAPHATTPVAKGAGGRQPGILTIRHFSLSSATKALRRIVITGRPDLGMPNYAEGTERPADFRPLTSTEIDDIVALLAAWRVPGQPAAQTTNTRTE